MLKILVVSFVVLSLNAFSQTPNNTDSKEEVKDPDSSRAAYLVRTKKKTIQAPAIIAPVENLTPANCADSLGGKGSANFTACEAGKKTR